VLFERIESEGLAHYSYLIGDGRQAVVIDPRRDCEIYLDKAVRAGYRIVHILETHRNEDYAIGSPELAARTGATIWHADAQWDYQYGRPARDGQRWQVGQYSLQALHTPGHTPGSMSYVLHELDGAAWMVFTGDALFAGDVGRVDLLGMDRAHEMANLLHASLFERLLPLGDGVVVCPAHGPGSACGTAIADRTWTTIGLERRLNPRLQFTDGDDFVANVARELERPPYFRRMEPWNLEGPPLLGTLPTPPALTPEEFAQQAYHATILDTRNELEFGAAHVPGALSIWLAGMPGFAGWFLPYDRPLLLVNETDDPMPVVRRLIRLGYDDIVGTLAGGMWAWHTAGLESQSVDMVTVQELCRRLDADEDAWILDVRSGEELEDKGRIPGAHQIHLTQLPHHLAEVPRDRSVYIFCGSAMRATVAASLLEREGWEQVVVVLGGITGWNSISCQLE
jgi:hydroxyacylglutathione hydrolase